MVLGRRYAADHIRPLDKELVMDSMIDITGAEIVEVQVRSDGKVLWVNIDGICRLRVNQINHLKILKEKDK